MRLSHAPLHASRSGLGQIVVMERRNLESCDTDRPLPGEAIFVPLVATLTLAAMLLLLEKMLRLFDFVVSGAAVTVRLADARQSIPQYSVSASRSG